MSAPEAPVARSRDYVPFIILATNRTGSTMLAASLNEHPEIICFLEIFNYGLDFVGYGVPGYDGKNADDYALRDRDRPAFVNERIFCDHPKDVRAVGFKFHYEHIWMVPDVLDMLVGMKDLRVIHLRRRNLLRSRVSQRFAEMTESFGVSIPQPISAVLTPANAVKALLHPARATKALRNRLAARRPPPQPEREPITVIPTECELYFKWVEHNATQYGDAFAGHPLVNIYYEDLVADRETVLRELQMFLGVQPQPLRVATRQQNPEPLQDLIANFDELREAFKDTQYAVFFE